LATSFAAAAGGNLSGNYAAALPLPDRVKAVYDVVEPDPFGAGAVVRWVNYRLYQGKQAISSSSDEIIRKARIQEKLLYSYGQRPPEKGPSPAGGVFEDGIGTRGKEPFGLTQEFFAILQGKPPIRVQIEPCIANGTFGPPRWENINKVTSLTVLISEDAGSTSARSCGSQQ
jgi:hypothetical protein